MPEPVAVGAVEVRMVVQSVHLVHTNAFEARHVGVERVDERARLTVRDRHDDIRVLRHVREDGLRVGRRPHDHGPVHTGRR